MRRLAEVEESVNKGTFAPDDTRSGRFKKRKAAETDGLFILPKLYNKVHVRRSSTRVSICGRASVDKPAFEMFVDYPKQAKSECLKCFSSEATAK